MKLMCENFVPFFMCQSGEPCSNQNKREMPVCNVFSELTHWTHQGMRNWEDALSEKATPVGLEPTHANVEDF